MPNYQLVATPTYNPMSYEQYAKPFEDYAKVYYEMANNYDTLQLQVNELEELANNAEDAEQYAAYKNYANALKAAAEDLNTNGLDIKTRGVVSDLRGRYGSEIMPIKNAVARRNELIKEQREALLKDPSLIFSFNADSGLGNYMGKMPEVKSYSLNYLESAVSNAAANLAREISTDLSAGRGDKWRSILGGQYFEKAIRTGLTAEEVVQSFFDGNGNIKPEVNKYLQAIAENALTESGIPNWNNWDNVQDRVHTAINRGLWSSIGQMQFKNLANRAYTEPGTGAGNNTITSSIPINPRYIYSRNDKNFIGEIANNNNKAFEFSDGAYRITDGAFGNLIRSAKKLGENLISIYDDHVEINPQDALLKNIMELALQTDPNWTEEDAVTLFKDGKDREGNDVSGDKLREFIDVLINSNIAMQYDNDPLSFSDASRYTEYVYQYDSSEQKEIKNAIMGSRAPIYKVNWDNKDKMYKSTGEQINLNDYDILEGSFSSVNGNYNQVITIRDKDGNVEQVALPRGINTRNESALENTMITLERVRKELMNIYKTLQETEDYPYISNGKGGDRVDKDGNKTKHSQETLEALEEQYKLLLQNAYKYYSQIGLPYKAKSFEFGHYGN